MTVDILNIFLFLGFSFQFNFFMLTWCKSQNYIIHSEKSHFQPCLLTSVSHLYLSTIGNNFHCFLTFLVFPFVI